MSDAVLQTLPERLEVRRNDDGTIDEILVYVEDRCVMHIEQMSKFSWYLGVYIGDDQPEQFGIHSRKRVTIRNYRDPVPTDG